MNIQNAFNFEECHAVISFQGEDGRGDGPPGAISGHGDGSGSGYGYLWGDGPRNVGMMSQKTGCGMEGDENGDGHSEPNPTGLGY